MGGVMRPRSWGFQVANPFCPAYSHSRGSQPSEVSGEQVTLSTQLGTRQVWVSWPDPH